MARRGRMMSRIAMPFGHTVSQRPQVVHCQGREVAATSSGSSSSMCLTIRLTLKFLTPVMGQAELQHPHCSQVLNIRTSPNFSANAVFASIIILVKRLSALSQTNFFLTAY
jgi:hypothetical protein